MTSQKPPSSNQSRASYSNLKAEAFNCIFVHVIGANVVLSVGVLGPTAHLGLPLKVFLGVGRCQRL
jgi:DMSO reductase anchor subunit